MQKIIIKQSKKSAGIWHATLRDNSLAKGNRILSMAGSDSPQRALELLLKNMPEQRALRERIEQLEEDIRNQNNE